MNRGWVAQLVPVTGALSLTRTKKNASSDGGEASLRLDSGQCE